uniref:Uncharacterized protein n=1 Tax=Neobodo designis TaxID=312471 RepID=A0A7S1QZY1_NEODS|mmetsp:Transcript_5640/g.17757  ORF Transcript_5640/g.17757 Transcript_5640/m.17757 type:complete len:150 (+) Transcript_5640:40-489(+)|eukprot:CAMPEP_0174827704 /NCGR_PEP_ID=MMETSP1114-20130205/887_1 /TAXON_ID=312471 /ORGANISM="Neobodo designis, Strain CCAP 1951/1" /LENGTH=149 /DNA_ID=CAMNT_0016061379 /DNA_START=34 /DNA_END=483 /DNA_ORIENTATION=-
MAPSKALWIQRIFAADFLGMNWSKITHMGPFQAGYPYQSSANPIGKIFSHPAFMGNRVNRMGFNRLRIGVVGLAPVALSLVAVVFWWDWYTPIYLASLVSGYEIPEKLQQKKKDELLWQSRYGVGILHKHTVGGQVSIPGSEVLVQPPE